MTTFPVSLSSWAAQVPEAAGEAVLPEQPAAAKDSPAREGGNLHLSQVLTTPTVTPCSRRVLNILHLSNISWIRADPIAKASDPALVRWHSRPAAVPSRLGSASCELTKSNLTKSTWNSQI